MKELSLEKMVSLAGGEGEPEITCTKVYAYNTNPLGTGGMQIDLWYCNSCGGGSCTSYMEFDYYYEK